MGDRQSGTAARMHSIEYLPNRFMATPSTEVVQVAGPGPLPVQMRQVRPLAG